jgi:hypothetical protein
VKTVVKKASYAKFTISRFSTIGAIFEAVNLDCWKNITSKITVYKINSHFSSPN